MLNLLYVDQSCWFNPPLYSLVFLGASLIAEQNVEKSSNNNSNNSNSNNNSNTYEKAHFEMVKNFLRSDDPTARKLTITKLPPNNKPASTSAQRGRLPFRRGGGDSERKPRPHSMSALPSASEADFTELLAGLMNENGGDDDVIESATNNNSLSNGGASSAR